MRKYQARPKKHPRCNKRSRVQRQRRDQEINMELNSGDVKDSEQVDGFQRSEIIDTSVSKETDCPADFFPNFGSETSDFSTPEVRAYVPQ
ncbi:hypothetical protein X975_09031, partial [Stegodyphus mimosarum]